MNTFLNKTKYQRYLQLRKSEKLVPHLPDTNLFSPEAFSMFIKRYSEIMLKPAIGSRGAGIFKVSLKGGDNYEIHTESLATTLKGIANTFDYFMKKKKPCPYIIQQRVPLAEIDGCPMDFRVMVQRKKVGTPWSVTGKLARLAGSDYVVTNNARSKATIMMPLEALQHIGVDQSTGESISKKIDSITLEAAEQLTKYHPLHRVWGLDIGVDLYHHIWIIEANNSPMIISFGQLKDPNAYHLIKQYKNG